MFSNSAEHLLLADIFLHLRKFLNLQTMAILFNDDRLAIASGDIWTVAEDSNKCRLSNIPDREIGPPYTELMDDVIYPRCMLGKQVPTLRTHRFH
jgi:hypothetical protein